MGNPDGRTLPTSKAVTRYVAYCLWDAYQKADVAQMILKLGVDVNGTKIKVALSAILGRFDGYLCAYGGGRRALHTKYEYVSSSEDWHALPQPTLSRTRAQTGRLAVHNSANHRVIVCCTECWAYFYGALG